MSILNLENDEINKAMVKGLKMLFVQNSKKN